VLAGVLAALLGAGLVTATMLMAVGEREREIGLKMAFGARRWHVALEHALEAALLGLAGGLLGLALGAGLAWLLDLAGASIGMDVFLVTRRLAEISVGLAAAVGAVAGVVPALRAARLDSSRALRAL
jgi:putative ABC transport system permease protein